MREFVAAVLILSLTGAVLGAAADQTTPRGAVKVFAQSVQNGQVQSVRGCLHTANATEEQFAQGYADVSVAMAKLRQAIAAKFGEEATAVLGGAGKGQDFKNIDAAAEAIDGDTAVVSVKGPAPLRLDMVRVGGLWRISVGKMLAGQAPEKVKAALTDMQALSKAAEETASEIAAGKHASINAALEAFKKKHAALVAGGSSSAGEKGK